MRHVRRSIVLLLACVLGVVMRAAFADPPTWVLVETHDRTLSVLQGAKVVDRFPDIALGRGGTGWMRQRGDDHTPLGEFHIAWINRSSPFHIFMGLDFPTIDYADRAYRENLIDRNTYDSILDAMRERRLPPQNTPLGGRIGIHGLGRGSEKIHHQFNWTEGCVALTNTEIERLAHWVQIGTRVVIR